MKDKYLHETLSKSKKDHVKYCIQICRELLAKKKSISLLFQKKNCSFLVEFLLILGKIKFCLGTEFFILLLQKNLKIFIFFKLNYRNIFRVLQLARKHKQSTRQNAF